MSESDASHHHAGHDHHNPAHRRPGALRADLHAAEADFARALKPAHEELKLATLVAAGATLLFDQTRLGVDEFRGRLEEAHEVYLRGLAAITAIAPPLGERQREYVAAAEAADDALAALYEAALIDEGRERRVRFRQATARLAEANLQMRATGETFWEAEYVPTGSEGVYHTH